MTTLYITRGLPASGKTTRAKGWVAEDSKHRARVNRDDLRAMLHDGFVDQERTIIAARDAAITALLKRGVDVVSDDTNLPSRTVRDLRKTAKLAGADFDVWDMTNVPYGTCVGRNAVRDHKVGGEVIYDMWAKYVRGKPYPLPLAEDREDEPGDVYVPDPNKPPAIIVDIDGTVALHGDRSPYDESRVHEDRPNQLVIDAVKAMANDGYRVIFCSGRHSSCFEETWEWLTERVHIGRFEMLLMRPDGDMRKDAIVKRELFDEYIRNDYDVRAVFDDRDQVVRMWRDLGLTVFQVADGAF